MNLQSEGGERVVKERGWGLGRNNTGVAENLEIRAQELEATVWNQRQKGFSLLGAAMKGEHEAQPQVERGTVELHQH